MFENITTLDELRKAYRAAAFAAHPDHGGSTEAMQEVNAAYEKRFEPQSGRRSDRQDPPS